MWKDKTVTPIVCDPITSATSTTSSTSPTSSQQEEDSDDKKNKQRMRRNTPFASKVVAPQCEIREDQFMEQEEARKLMQDLDGNSFTPLMASMTTTNSVTGKASPHVKEIPLWNVNEFSEKQRERKLTS